MSQTGDSLVVRQHERHACAFDVVLASRSEGVVLAQSVGGAGRPGGGGAAGAVVFGATLVDLSLGGLGIQSDVYLPKRSLIIVRLELPERVLQPGESASMETVVVVQRAVMSDRRPSYYLGTAFTDAQGVDAREFSRRLLRVMQLEQGTPTAAGAAGRAAAPREAA